MSQQHSQQTGTKPLGMCSPSKLGLAISDADLDVFSLGDDLEEVGFSTQIAAANGHDSAIQATTSSLGSNSNKPTPPLRTYNKKEPTPVGNHSPEFYIDYLKSRVERETECAKQRQLKAHETSRLLKTSSVANRKNEFAGGNEPRTAFSSPDLGAPILRPLMSNRFRLKTQSSFNSRSQTFDGKSGKSNNPRANINYNTNNNNRQNMLGKRVKETFDDGKTEFTLLKTKTIIDLNTIGQESHLSGHYLFETSDSRRRNNHANYTKLGDLRLTEMWPQSNMCKLSQKTNAWVRTQQEKSVANELNSFFRISRQQQQQFSSSPRVFGHQLNGNRLENSPYFCLLPTFKYTM